MPPTSVAHRRRRQLRCVSKAAHQGGVLSRRQLYALGLTRAEVRAEISAGRWRSLSRQCVLVGLADDTTPWWCALLDVGPTAVLDGISALLAAGLRTITADCIHVAVPPGAWYRPVRGVRVHETRRLRPEDVIRRGIPRTRPATAAVHAALWARSDSEAALLLMAAVQQRRVTTADLAEAVARVHRHRRRELLQGLLRDVTEGVESIGEREFALACRRRGFPEPTRQGVRRLPSGRYVYDVQWEPFGVEVEIDGIQHLDAASATRDALKQNVATLSGSTLLRIPAFAFRSDPGPFLDQVEAALRRGGWQGPLRQRKRAS